MDVGTEMAIIAKQELEAAIGENIILLSLDPERATGKVTGKFRSSTGVIFSYELSEDGIQYGPLRGAAAGRKDGEDDRSRGVILLMVSERPLSVRDLARIRCDALAIEDPFLAYADSYLATATWWPRGRRDSWAYTCSRMDAKQKKRCTTGFGCGATCISTDKRCRLARAWSGQKGPDGVGRLVELARGENAPAELHKGYHLTPPEFAAYEGTDKTARKLADALYKFYADREPEITQAMVDLADQAGGTLRGLKHRIKQPKSLGRKIANEAPPPRDRDAYLKTAKGMSDVVRYTLQLPPESYGRGTKETLRKLEDQGWGIRAKNYWSPGQPYKGLNVALTSPDGYQVELQIHTAESLRVKADTHKLYEEYRVEKDNGRRRELFDAMVKRNNRIKHPWEYGTKPGSRARKQHRREVLGIGTRKKVVFQTAEEAGLV